MSADCLMPLMDRPRTRPDGTAYTIDDKEYWHLDRDGGIRRGIPNLQYPRMLYRGMLGDNGKPTYDTRIAETSREHEALVPFGWLEHPAEAIQVFVKGQEATEQAAAEVAAAVQRMSEQARAESAAESARNPEHVTDVVAQPRRKPGPKPKGLVTE